MSKEQVEAYLKSKGWDYTLNKDEFELDCPFCGKDGGHFQINTETHLFHCFSCSKGGRGVRRLKVELGDASPNYVSLKDSVPTVITLPDVNVQHQNLKDYNEALEYFLVDRQIHAKVIDKMKLGFSKQYFKKIEAHSPAVSYPYFVNGKAVFIKYRTLPPEKKAFISTEIDDIPLYNQDCLQKGIDRLLITEGELDLLTLLSQGYEHVVAVPGAGIKKSLWVGLIDSVAPKSIYIILDNDPPGIEGARKLAEKIGLNKAKVVTLPPFTDAEGNAGKDINDWFRFGKTKEELEELVNSAKFLDVLGVHSLASIIDNLEEQFNAGVSLTPHFDSPWPSLNKIMGWCEYGDVVGITAISKIGKSTMALNWLDYFCRAKELSTFMYCLEMQPPRLAEKWISSVTRTKITDFNKDTFNLSRQVLREMKGELLFGSPKFTRADEIFETILQVKRRYGTDVVCFDNLHLLARSLEHRTNELDTLSKKFKQIAMELSVVLLLIVQPTKKRDGENITFRDARGTSAIVQDVDVGISLERALKNEITMNDFKVLGRFETEQTYDNAMLVKVDLSRFAAGGQCTLWFEGEYSSVVEFPNEETNNKILNIDPVISEL